MEGRATSEEDKRRKKELILRTTLELFEREHRFHTASEIAKAAKLAKGTLYLYFASKEEIYLELLLENFCLWHASLRNFMTEQRPSPSTLIAYICRSLLDYSIFVELTGFASFTLEENLSPDYVRQTRSKMQDERLKSCQLMASLYPQWSEERCLLNMRRFNTYAMAYWRECFSSTLARGASPDDLPLEPASRQQRYYEEILAMTLLIWGEATLR